VSIQALSNPHSSKKYENPKAELDRLWKLVLLNQFHDVLPGSAIEMVYQDAEAYYEDVTKSGTILRKAALDALNSSLVGFSDAQNTPG
jgi:alpha-mannosidase